MESLVDGDGGGNRLVMTELSHIIELVRQLDVHLGGCPELCKHLAAQIFTVTEKSISMISRSGHFDGLKKRSSISAGLDSPPSPLSGVSGMAYKPNKKRKTMEKGTHQIRVSSAGGGAETLDDGFSWRKYGQKEILGAKHPRGYYRCTYQKTQRCAATKQVQRADEDPTLFDVIYHGTHTCVHKTAAAGRVQPATPNTDARSLPKSLSSSLTVNTEGLTSGPQQSTPFSFSSPAVSSLAPSEHYPSSMPSTPFQLELSPATSDSKYIPMNPFEAEWRAQSELQEMVSALVAATSMPEQDFSLDGFELSDFDVSIFFA